MLVCHFFILAYTWPLMAELHFLERALNGKLSTLAWGVPTKVINIWHYEMVMIGIVDCCGSPKFDDEVCGMLVCHFFILALHLTTYGRITLPWESINGNQSTLAWGVPTKVINISQYEMVMIGIVDCCDSLKSDDEVCGMLVCHFLDSCMDWTLMASLTLSNEAFNGKQHPSMRCSQKW